MTNHPGNIIRTLTAAEWDALSAPFRVVRKVEKRAKKSNQPKREGE